MLSDETLSSPDAVLERRIDSVLRELRGSIGDLRAAAVVTTDGMAIASWVAGEGDIGPLAALAASTVAVLEQSRASEQLGNPSQVLVQARDSYFVTMPVGSQVLLTVRAGLNARPGLVLLKMKQAARRLELVI